MRRDVVDGVLADEAIPRLIVGRVRRCAFESDDINADVVVVMDQIVGDGEGIYVAIKSHGLAAAGPEMVDLIAANGDVVERRWRPVSVEGDAERVGGAS